MNEHRFHHASAADDNFPGRWWLHRSRNFNWLPLEKSLNYSRPRRPDRSIETRRLRTAAALDARRNSWRLIQRGRSTAHGIDNRVRLKVSDRLRLVPAAKWRQP